MPRCWLRFVCALSVAACSDIPVNHDTAEKCGCVAEPVRISPLESPFSTTATVAPCRTFILDVAAIGARAESSCSMPMICPPQSGEGGVSDPKRQMTGIDVARAVAHPDVEQALRDAPIRYGAGPGTPGGGGPVSRLGVGLVDFEVGGPCGSEPCTPVPAGVKVFLDVMLAVNAQEIRRSPCRELLNR